MEEAWNQRTIITLRLKGRELRLTPNLIIIAILLAVTAMVPLSGMPRYFVSFIMFLIMFVALTCSWNMFVGYAGYFSFGHIVFFGIGAYSSSLLIINLDILNYWPLAAIAGGVFAMGFALLISYPILRLRGPYFSITMLGINSVMMILVQSHELEWLTHGGWGVTLPLYRDLAALFYGMMITGVLAFAFMYKIRNSKIGYGLIGIREDEDVAQFMGINTTRLKITAFVLSSFFIGVAGGIYALYLSYIDAASVFNINVNFNFITMTMFGGLGTIWGPVIGAVTLGTISEYLWATYPEVHLVILGSLIVSIVIFAPEGLMGLFKSNRFKPVLRYIGLIPWHEEVEGEDIESVEGAEDEGAEIETPVPVEVSNTDSSDEVSPTEGDPGG